MKQHEPLPKASHTQRSTRKKWYMLVGIILVIGLLYSVLKEHVSLAAMQEKSAHFKQLVDENYLRAATMYVVVYTFLITCALPVLIPLTLIGGFLFGTLAGALLSALASVMGCIISFVGFRYLMRSTLMAYFGVSLERFHAHFKLHGIYYLLMLHYSSLVPFFMINAIAALTDMSLLTFIVVTIFGCFPVCLIYAFAGRQLSTIGTLTDIFSPAVVAAFLLLLGMACIPILIRRFKRSRRVQDHTK
jgi:uncharacterized membrane protein YdjX (TVP38/TMEM64 family)